MIQYISMILGMAVVIFMMTRRWNPVIIGISASAVVIFLNGLPYGDSMGEIFFPSFAGMFQTLFPPIFSGSLLAKTYKRSGAVVTLADRMTELVFHRLGSRRGESQYAKAILAIVIVAGGIAYCGMNSLVVLIVMYPIALRVMEKAGIPKRFVMGILSGGVYTFALVGPGSAEIVNVLAMQVVGTPSHAGLVGGFIAMLVEVAVMTLVLSRLIRRAVERGERFAPGPNDSDFSRKTAPEDRPGALRALIPLAVLMLLFNVFNWGIFPATMSAWLLSLLLFRSYLRGLEDLKDTCVKGAVSAFGPVSSVGALVGFTAIIQSLPNFQLLMDSVFQLRVHAALILILSISIVAGLTGSSSSAIRIGVPLVLQRCRAGGLTDAFVHRVSCFAATTIDTLPWSTAVIINLNIGDLKLEEAYPPMFVATCLATVCGTAICAAVMYLFPFLP